MNSNFILGKGPISHSLLFGFFFFLIFTYILYDCETTPWETWTIFRYKKLTDLCILFEYSLSGLCCMFSWMPIAVSQIVSSVHLQVSSNTSIGLPGFLLTLSPIQSFKTSAFWAIWSANSLSIPKWNAGVINRLWKNQSFPGDINARKQVYKITILDFNMYLLVNL